MTPTRFAAPLPIPTESDVSYDRIADVCRSLAIRSNLWRDADRSKLKDDALELIQDLAQENAQLRIERDDLLGVIPSDPLEAVDVVTDAEAVAFITRVSNHWKH